MKSRDAILAELSFRHAQARDLITLASENALALLLQHYRELIDLGFNNNQITRLTIEHDGTALTTILKNDDYIQNLKSLGFTIDDIFEIAINQPNNLTILFENSCYLNFNEKLTVENFVKYLSGNQSSVACFLKVIQDMLTSFIPDDDQAIPLNDEVVNECSPPNKRPKIDETTTSHESTKKTIPSSITSVQQGIEFLESIVDITERDSLAIDQQNFTTHESTEKTIPSSITSFQQGMEFLESIVDITERDGLATDQQNSTSSLLAQLPPVSEFEMEKELVNDDPIGLLYPPEQMTASATTPTWFMSGRIFAHQARQITNSSTSELFYKNSSNTGKVIRLNQLDEIQVDDAGNIYIEFDKKKLLLLPLDIIKANKNHSYVLFKKIAICLDSQKQIIGVVFNSNPSYRYNYDLSEHRVIKVDTLLGWIRGATTNQAVELRKQLEVAQLLCRDILNKAKIEYKPQWLNLD